MYKQFCKNLQNYIRINSESENEEFTRLRIAKEILPLTDLTAYISYKKCKDHKYREIGQFIDQLSRYTKMYPSLNKFIWELWAYGFDVVKPEEPQKIEDKYMLEKVKLIDLMLSTHYFD